MCRLCNAPRSTDRTYLKHDPSVEKPLIVMQVCEQSKAKPIPFTEAKHDHREDHSDAQHGGIRREGEEAAGVAACVWREHEQVI